MDIFAKIIKGIRYKPLLTRELNTFNINDIDKVLSSEATFILNVGGKNQIALSWWTSAKRTRTYPCARVYDSLNFVGKKATIIPIFKDEGYEGDRDFLQWDTISLMSLLGVYVIISHYKNALPSSRYACKITQQRFDTDQIRNEINNLLSYQSDALHWNLSQIDKVGQMGQQALQSYDKISRRLGIKMHSRESADKRIKKLLEDKNVFMDLSRELAEKAQKRETVTKQPKEKLSGTKATLTIKNYLGGLYYFTVDEFEIKENNLYLIEGKHTKDKNLPSLNDIKDGLLKMILFTNLENVMVKNKIYISMPILKLTTGSNFRLEDLNKSNRNILSLLQKEAKANGFKVLINYNFIC